MIDLIHQSWPWYIAGPLIGLTVPALYILGNKTFGLSSSLRHICAACIPANIPFFQYNWKKESWNLLFVAGIFLGAVLTNVWLPNEGPLQIHPELAADLAASGIDDYSHLIPSQLFNWDELLSVRGFVFTVIGGFLVGFGTRWAGGCTSGHAITGLSTLQWPSLIATICFMIGGLICANLIVPFILSL
jgi:uncharacterized membrane protein YedE/YeeE